MFISPNEKQLRMTAAPETPEEYEPFDLAAEAARDAAAVLLLAGPGHPLDLTGARETYLPAASYTFLATADVGYAAGRFVAEAGDGGTFTARLVERYHYAVAELGDEFEDYHRDEAGAMQRATELSNKDRDKVVEVVELDGTFGGRRIALMLDGDVYRRD
jgi:hypothetical protein